MTAGAGTPVGQADLLDLDPLPGRAWSGSGGRWRLWPFRAVLWAALLVVAYRGVTAIVFGQAGPAPADGASSAGAARGQFPVALAEAYASEFGQVYLNLSPATQAQREQELAAFLPASVAAANPDLGWNGTGQLSLQSEQVAGIAVQDRQHAVVTLLATVNGQLMELGVPVIASSGSVVVAGEPAWLPAPAPVSPPPAVAGGSDPVARNQLLTELPAFFQAYADGDSAALSRFTARGVSLTGLGGAVAFGSIASLDVPPGGATRDISVTVIWQVPSQASAGVAKLAMSYRMSVVDLQSGKWYVNEISASTEAVGAK
ncbi:MAG TPA: conjugal transfer protein [Streptosporangiaceae bacterium]|nr:conjugal transfer protein [Streptosporangiaceae bacterium]